MQRLPPSHRLHSMYGRTYEGLHAPRTWLGVHLMLSIGHLRPVSLQVGQTRRERVRHVRTYIAKAHTHNYVHPHIQYMQVPHIQTSMKCMN